MPTQSSSQRSEAPRMYSRWPRWKGWKRPWIIPRCTRGLLFDVDAGAFLNRADAADEETARRELGLERRPLFGRKRNQQPAGCLGVVPEHDERIRHAVQRQMPAGEVAVSRIAAGADALAGDIEGAVDRRETFRLEPQLHAASIRHLVDVAEE